MTAAARDFLAAVPLQTRVVVRFALHGEAEAATDALGTLTARTDGSVDVQTRRGVVTVALADVIAAKQVPPPPAPRPRNSVGSEL